MNTRTLVTTVKTLHLCGLLVLIAACSPSIDNGPDCRYNEAWLSGECSFESPQPVSASGIWKGTDSAGGDVLILVSAVNSLRLIDASGNQGVGFIAPMAAVAVGFELVTPLGGSFSDETTLANCNFTGSLVERERIELDQSCVTTAGLQFSEVLELDFDPLYDVDSSLEAISGSYQSASGSVLSVAADGGLFLQDAATGCVINGAFKLITSSTNLYGLSLQYESCAGPEEILNGSSFDGLAYLDDTGTADVLVMAATGDVAGTAVSSFEQATRL